MDTSRWKGSAPTRETFYQNSQCFPKNLDVDDLNPLSDGRMDQSNTISSDAPPIRTANNCSLPYFSWPAHVTISPATACSSQLPVNPPNPIPSTVISPNLRVPSPLQNVDFVSNHLLGGSQMNPQLQQCQIVPLSWESTSESTPKTGTNIIQSLCYGPVSEGHYFVMQPMCCYLKKEPIEKEKEVVSRETEKEEVEEEPDDNVDKVKNKSKKQKKAKPKRGKSKQKGKHNSVGTGQGKPIDLRAINSAMTTAVEFSKSRNETNHVSKRKKHKALPNRESALDEDYSTDISSFYDLQIPEYNEQ